MTHDAMTEHYEEITVCGKPALFTSIRIKRDTVPEGLYAYDVRHDDECRGIPCEIAPFIMVNHWGTIILTEPLELPSVCSSIYRRPSSGRSSGSARIMVPQWLTITKGAISQGMPRHSSSCWTS